MAIFHPLDTYYYPSEVFGRIRQHPTFILCNSILHNRSNLIQTSIFFCCIYTGAVLHKLYKKVKPSTLLLLIIAEHLILKVYSLKIKFCLTQVTSIEWFLLWRNSFLAYLRLPAMKFLFHLRLKSPWHLYSSFWWHP